MLPGQSSTQVIRETLESKERLTLSPNAVLSSQSKGRARHEPEHPYRTCFQRDRDRILHSKAFRRLAHKTQVFLAPEGDHYRVRLTHTLEVTQVARTISRALALNEDLVEAICLGHDLGHTPFGHLGEEILSEFLGRQFRHSEHSLRIVESLENEGRGLNLTWEVRDGIRNHTWSSQPPATLEGQVARFADRIAYINHDLDDALRAGVLRPQDVPEASLRVLGSTIRERLDCMVGSLVTASSDEAISMEREVFDAMQSTRAFLFERVYQRPEAGAEHERARAVLRGLLDYFAGGPHHLPQVAPGDGSSHEDRVADYVAGMTDRFARREYERICADGWAPRRLGHPPQPPEGAAEI